MVILLKEEKRRQRLIQERQHQDKELKMLKQKAKEQEGKIKGRIIRGGYNRDKLSYNIKEERAQKGQTKAHNQFANRIDTLTENLVDIIPERSKISFDFHDNPAFNSNSSLVLDATDLKKTFSDILFYGVSFHLKKGDRLIIQGPNGSGKSTLLNIIMNLIQADEGFVNISTSNIGYLDQEQASLSLEKSAVELLQEDPKINATYESAITNLSQFGVYNYHDLKSSLKMLSIGCRRKVQLCQIILRKCPIILLDEPTNHIDFPSLEAIEDILLDFPGIIVATTHDRYFSEKVGTHILNLEQFQFTKEKAEIQEIRM